MFGLVVGKRKALIHRLFPGNIRKFARAIADIHRVVKPDLSFLDLTSFNAGAGRGIELRPVGVMFASSDPVALDALAAQAVGYENVKIWTTYWGQRLGVGCSDVEKIQTQGMDWCGFEKKRLKLPELKSRLSSGGLCDRISNLVNQTVFRPRATINEERCTGCGECAVRCPVHSIESVNQRRFRVDHSECVDCHCCLAVCEEGAINLQFQGIAREMRRITGRVIEIQSGDLGRPAL